MSANRSGTPLPLVLLPGLSTVAANTGHLAWLQRWLERRNLGKLGKLTVLDYTRLNLVESIEQVADACAALLREEFTGPVMLLGHSTGGSIALALASRHPELISHLLLISTACKLGETGLTAQLGAAAMLRRGEIRAGAAVLAAGVSIKPVARFVLGALGRLLPHTAFGMDPKRLLPYLEIEEPFDVSETLSQISAKTLLVGGAFDGFYSQALFEETTAAIPDAECVILPHAGHLAAWESGVLKVLRRFLSQV